MNPLFSLITVVRNDIEGLTCTANSILSQSTKDFEWLIVDGYSDDGSYEYAKSLSTHTFVSLMQTSPKGIYNAMNFGAVNSNSTWIWFINAGDIIISEEIVDSLTIIARNNSKASIIASSVVYLTPSQHYYSISIPQIICKDASKYALFHHQGSIMNRRVFLEKGGFDEQFKFAADGKILDSMVTILDPVILPIVTVGFEMGGATSSNFWRSLKEIRIYRKPVLAKKTMLISQIKEIIRAFLLKAIQTSIGSRLLSSYIIRREKAVLTLAQKNGIEIPDRGISFE